MVTFHIIGIGSRVLELVINVETRRPLPKFIMIGRAKCGFLLATVVLAGAAIFHGPNAGFSQSLTFLEPQRGRPASMADSAMHTAAVAGT
jgi:hypothetical protein